MFQIELESRKICPCSPFPAFNCWILIVQAAPEIQSGLQWAPEDQVRDIISYKQRWSSGSKIKKNAIFFSEHLRQVVHLLLENVRLTAIDSMTLTRAATDGRYRSSWCACKYVVQFLKNSNHERRWSRYLMISTREYEKSFSTAAEISWKHWFWQKSVKSVFLNWRMAW